MSISSAEKSIRIPLTETGLTQDAIALIQKGDSLSKISDDSETVQLARDCYKHAARKFHQLGVIWLRARSGDIASEYFTEEALVSVRAHRLDIAAEALRRALDAISLGWKEDPTNDYSSRSELIFKALRTEIRVTDQEEAARYTALAIVFDINETPITSCHYG